MSGTVCMSQPYIVEKSFRRVWTNKSKSLHTFGHNVLAPVTISTPRKLDDLKTPSICHVRFGPDPYWYPSSYQDPPSTFSIISASDFDWRAHCFQDSSSFNLTEVITVPFCIAADRFPKLWSWSGYHYLCSGFATESSWSTWNRSTLFRDCSLWRIGFRFVRSHPAHPSKPFFHGCFWRYMSLLWYKEEWP